jgi:hypothetical protein
VVTDLQATLDAIDEVAVHQCSYCSQPLFEDSVSRSPSSREDQMSNGKIAALCWFVSTVFIVMAVRVTSIPVADPSFWYTMGFIATSVGIAAAAFGVVAGLCWLGVHPYPIDYLRQRRYRKRLRTRLLKARALQREKELREMGFDA